MFYHNAGKTWHIHTSTPQCRWFQILLSLWSHLVSTMWAEPDSHPNSLLSLLKSMKINQNSVSQWKITTWVLLSWGFPLDFLLCHKPVRYNLIWGVIWQSGHEHGPINKSQVRCTAEPKRKKTRVSTHLLSRCHLSTIIKPKYCVQVKASIILVKSVGEHSLCSLWSLWFQW